MNIENILIARICHDLITPLNAINLGLEAFEASRDDELLPIIKESVEKSNTIMQFMRELFSEHAESFCYTQISLNQSISDFLKFYNVSFNLRSDMEQIAYIAGKIIMYLAIIAKEIMPYGGSVEVQINDGIGTITTKCTGKNMIIPEMDINQEITYKSVIKYKLLQLLEKSEMKLLTYKDGENIIFCCNII